MSDLFGDGPKFKEGDHVKAANDHRSNCERRVIVKGDDAKVVRVSGAMILLDFGSGMNLWFQDHDWEAAE